MLWVSVSGYIVCISRETQSIYLVGNIVYVVGISCGYIMWVQNFLPLLNPVSYEGFI